MQRAANRLLKQAPSWPPPAGLAWRCCAAGISLSVPLFGFFLMSDSRDVDSFEEQDVFGPQRAQGAGRGEEMGDDEVRLWEGLSSALLDMRAELDGRAAVDFAAAMDRLAHACTLLRALADRGGGASCARLDRAMRAAAQVNALAYAAARRIVSADGSGGSCPRRAADRAASLSAAARGIHASCAAEARRRSARSGRPLRAATARLSRRLPPFPADLRSAVRRVAASNLPSFGPSALRRRLQRRLGLLGPPRGALRAFRSLVSLLSAAEALWVSASLGLGLLSGALNALRYHFYSKLVNHVQRRAAPSVVADDLLAALSASLLDLSCRAVAQQCREKGGAAAALRAQDLVFSRLLRTPLPERRPDASRKQRLLRDCARLDADLVRLPLECLSLLAQVLGGYLSMLVLSPRLLLLAVAAAPLANALCAWPQMAAEGAAAALRRSEERRWALDGLLLGSHLRTLRQLGLAARAEAARALWSRRQGALRRRAAALRAAGDLAELAPLALRLAVVWTGGVLVAEGRLGAGDLLSFVTLSDVASADLGALRAMLPRTYEALEPASRVLDLLLGGQGAAAGEGKGGAGGAAAPGGAEGRGAEAEEPSEEGPAAPVSLDKTLGSGETAAPASLKKTLGAGETAAPVSPDKTLAAGETAATVSPDKTLGEGETAAPLSLEKTLAAGEGAATVPPSTAAGGGEEAAALLEARGLSFSYGAAAAGALRGVDLCLRRGEVVALVGASGCGKSTLLAVLGGLFRPSSGSVLLREGASAALVEQRPKLFPLSVRDNIACGADPKGPRPSDAAVRAAAAAAGAASFIAALPGGFATLVGPEGASGRRPGGGRGAAEALGLCYGAGRAQLSGGEAARVAIARALMRRAEVLLLDEAFAALDAEAEERVRAAVFGAARAEGTALLLATHRLGNAAAADRVLVMEGGRVVEAGTHEELLDGGGRYRTLWTKQFS